MTDHDLHSHLTDLDAALKIWDGRDDTKPQPEVRRAGTAAMTAIDAMLAGLHQMRGVLVAEHRASDDATSARADARLAETRNHGTE